MTQSKSTSAAFYLLKRFFSIIFIGAGIIIFFQGSIIGGLIFSLAGVVLIPKYSDMLKEKFLFWQKRTVRVIFTVGVLLVGMIISSPKGDKSDKNTDTVTKKAKETTVYLQDSETVDKFIKGIVPVDVYGNFGEDKGYKLDKRISPDGSLFICSSEQNGISYEVKTYCENNANDVTSIRLSATRTNPQYNTVGDMKPFLKYGSSIPYDDANIEKVNAFIEANYFKNKASIVISGVRFTIYTPTQFARMINIERE